MALRHGGVWGVSVDELAAVGLVLRKPGQFLRTVSVRITQYWTYLGIAGGRGRFVAGAGYFPVLILAIVGMWAVRRQRQAQLLILFLLTMPLPFYVTWAVKGRFRFPVEPVLILFASCAVTLLLTPRLKQLNQRVEDGSGR